MLILLADAFTTPFLRLTNGECTKFVRTSPNAYGTHDPRRAGARLCISLSLTGEGSRSTPSGSVYAPPLFFGTVNDSKLHVFERMSVAKPQECKKRRRSLAAPSAPLQLLYLHNYSTPTTVVPWKKRTPQRRRCPHGKFEFRMDPFACLAYFQLLAQFLPPAPVASVRGNSNASQWPIRSAVSWWAPRLRRRRR